MLGFSSSWEAQTDGIDCWLSFATESAFAFDVNEPGSRRGAEASSEEGSKVSEWKARSGWSEFFDPRRRRAPQGIRPFGPDGGLGDSVFGYFFHEKSNSH